MCTTRWLGSTTISGGKPARSARVYVTPHGLDDLHIRLELQDNTAGTDVFDENTGAELQM